MLAENFERTLRGFTQRVPFRPFTVELVNGRQLVIEHPEALVFRNALVAVYIGLDGALTIFDHESVNQFTGAPDPQSASAPGFGTSR